MPSHVFRAALLAAAALTRLATAAGAQGFISPGAQAIPPPGRAGPPVASPTVGRRPLERLLQADADGLRPAEAF